MKSAGEKTPPEAPDPSVSDVVSSFRPNRTARNHEACPERTSCTVA